jgi:hypothetical protein
MEIKEAEENENVERRKNKRYRIPAVVKCKLFEEVVSGKNSFQGFIQDLSFGGVSLEIKDDFLNIKEDLIKYTNIEMELEFNSPDGLHKMSFSGIIKWYKRVKKKDKNVLNLHIQFHYLDEKSADVLMKYLSLGSGDKNLFWNLWDNLSMHS